MRAHSGEERQVNRELRQVIAELSVMPNVSAATIGHSSPSSDEDIGGRRPAGPEDGPAELLMRRVSGAEGIADPAYRLAAKRSILEDGRNELATWRLRRTREVVVPGDPLFPHEVARELREGAPEARAKADPKASGDPLAAFLGEVAHRRGVDRKTVREIRDRYVPELTPKKEAA